MGLAVRTIVLASMMLFGAAADAATLTWTLSGGTFSDGGTLSGTLTLDSASSNVNNWNLAVAGGGASFAARTYMPTNSSESAASIGGAQPTLFFTANDEANRVLRMTPTSALDGSASPVSLDVAFLNGNVECFNCSPFRGITAGVLTLTSASPGVTLVSAAPSPTTVGVATTITVSVAGVAALGTPTGTVTVLDNSSSPLCTLTLPATTCTFTPSAAGSQSLLAQYNGDASYGVALSNILALDIAAAPPPPPVVMPTVVPTLDGYALAALALMMTALAAVLKRRR